MYNDGNAYALFIRGFLEYDEALDSGNDAANALEKITCAADLLCFHAMVFSKNLIQINQSNPYIDRIDSIILGKPKYNTSYFNELNFIVELMKNPHLFTKADSNKIAPSTLPHINILEKIKQSANLFLSEPIFIRNYQLQEASYYGLMFSKLFKIATDIQIQEPALGKWGQTAVILCPTIVALGGLMDLCSGQKSAILTTVFAFPTIIYGIQTLFATPIISNISKDKLNYEIDLMSMYFTLKPERCFVGDTSNAKKAFNFCFSYNNFAQIYQSATGSLPTVNQMILEIEREEA